MAHNPVTFPEVSSKGSIIDTGKEAFIAVSAEYTESSPLVRNLDVKRRNCIFADEKNVPKAEITVFKFYSQVCICITFVHFQCLEKNLTFLPFVGKLSARMSSKNTSENLWMFAILLPKAGCHPPIPRRFPKSDSVLHSRGESCAASNLTCIDLCQGWKCLMSNKNILSALEPSGGEVTERTKAGLLTGASCFCPPSCTNTQYRVAHSMATFPNKASRVMEQLREKPKYQVS